MAGTTLFGLALAIGPVQASTPDLLSISVHRPADTWSATGAFSDSGTFSDDPFFFSGKSSAIHAVRTFSGGSGTFVARADGRIVATADLCVFAVIGSWTIVSGTADYEDLHGTGSIDESANVCTGVVEGTWDGSVHFH